MKKRLIAILMVVMSVAMLLAGCAQPTAETVAPAGAEDASALATGTEATEGAAKSTKDTLVIGCGDEAKTLDPQGTVDTCDYSIINNIYDTLIQLDLFTGEIGPRLAETWEMSDDKLTYTFHLRDGVKWQNGETFNANDVKYTYERAMTSAFCTAEVVNMESVEAVDDKTVVIKYSVADPYALQRLGAMNMSIVNQKAVETYGEDFGRNPVGTGSYKLASWSSGSDLVLEAFDGAWRGEPAIKTVTCRVIDDSSARIMALQSGDIDACIGMAATDVKKLKGVEGDGITYLEVSAYEIAYIGMNEMVAPFDNKLLRQAISYAINKEELLIGGVEGIGEVADSILASTLNGYADMSYPYDPEKAREVLNEAGYPDGMTFTAYFMSMNDAATVVPIIQAQLKNVGIEMNVEYMEANAWIMNIPNNNLFYITCKGQLPNADSALFAQLHSTMGGLSGNLTYVHNPEIDKLLEEGQVEFDQAKQAEIYEQVQALMKDDASMIPLYTSPKLGACREGLVGFRLLPLTLYECYDYYWEE